MASPLKLMNNAIGRLTAGMSVVDTTATLVSGNGALFPALGVGEFFPATIIRASDSAREIVKVTARSTDVLTVTRAQEGTSALIFIAGDRVELRLTGGTLSTELARVESVADAAQAAADAAQTDADAAQVDADAAAVDAAAAQATASAALPKAGGTMTGDLAFTGAGRRITGDMSNATHGDRLMFQTSATNSSTNVGALPSGSGTSAAFVAYSESDPANASGASMVAVSGEAQFSALALGTEPQPVMAFYVNGAKRAEISTSGVFRFNSGYGSVENAYGCRAWVNFNGVGVVSVRGSAGVSSVTDVAPGIYRVSFIFAFPDANYSAQVTGTQYSASADNFSVGVFVSAQGDGSTQTITSFPVFAQNANGIDYDMDVINVAVFR
jgi:hypothetical protein